MGNLLGTPVSLTGQKLINGITTANTYTPIVTAPSGHLAEPADAAEARRARRARLRMSMRAWGGANGSVWSVLPEKPAAVHETLFYGHRWPLHHKQNYLSEIEIPIAFPHLADDESRAPPLFKNALIQKQFSTRNK